MKMLLLLNSRVQLLMLSDGNYRKCSFDRTGRQEPYFSRQLAHLWNPILILIEPQVHPRPRGRQSVAIKGAKARRPSLNKRLSARRQSRPNLAENDDCTVAGQLIAPSLRTCNFYSSLKCDGCSTTVKSYRVSGEMDMFLLRESVTNEVTEICYVRLCLPWNLN